MAKHGYAFDAPNHPPNPAKTWRNPSNFTQILQLRVCLMMGRWSLRNLVLSEVKTGGN